MNHLTRFLSEREAQPGDLLVTDKGTRIIADAHREASRYWQTPVGQWNKAILISDTEKDIGQPIALYRPDWNVRERDFPHIALERIEVAKLPAPIDAEAVIREASRRADKEGTFICGSETALTRALIEALNAALTPLVAEVEKLKEGR